MNKYDKVYNLLVKQTANSELTLESAEFLNDVAYELYGDEIPDNSILYSEAANRMNDIWNTSKKQSEMGNTNKDLEDSEDEKDKDNKKWSLKKKIAIGAGVAGVGAAVAVGTNRAYKNNKRKIERNNLHNSANIDINNDYNSKLSNLKSLKAIGKITETEFNRRKSTLDKERDKAARKKYAEIESKFSKRSASEIEADIMRSEFKAKADKRALDLEEKRQKAEEKKRELESKKNLKNYEDISNKVDSTADAINSLYDSNPGFINKLKINSKERKFNRQVKKQIRASRKL